MSGNHHILLKLSVFLLIVTLISAATIKPAKVNRRRGGLTCDRCIIPKYLNREFYLPFCSPNGNTTYANLCEALCDVEKSAESSEDNEEASEEGVENKEDEESIEESGEEPKVNELSI